jgi:hypothetical protein
MKNIASNSQFQSTAVGGKRVYYIIIVWYSQFISPSLKAGLMHNDNRTEDR